MSREKREKFKNFLDRDGYLLVFTVLCALCLVSYFVANNTYKNDIVDKTQVLGTSSVRGVWISGISKSTCKDDSCFNDYSSLDTQELSLDDYGRLVFSNDRIFISGIFDSKKLVDSQVWEDVHIGDLNLKINNRQWVFENIVWNKEIDDSLISILEIEKGSLVILHPSMTLTGLSKNFWVFEYLDEKEFVRPVSFLKEDGRRAFVESTKINFLEKDSEVFLKLERLDPALMGNSELELYKYDENLELVRSMVLNAE